MIEFRTEINKMLADLEDYFMPGLDVQALENEIVKIHETISAHPATNEVRIKRNLQMGDRVMVRYATDHNHGWFGRINGILENDSTRQYLVEGHPDFKEWINESELELTP